MRPRIAFSLPDVTPHGASPQKPKLPPLSCPRMKLAMHSLKPLLIDVRVDLRCGNIGVAQHLLNDPQIGAVPEQMRRETVSKKVWVNVLLQSGAGRVFFYDLPEARCG